MLRSSDRVVVVGAGINGLVACNYLARAGLRVTLIERAGQVGGACVSATAHIDGVAQDYALGASVLGLMQDFVWQETGLDDRLKIYAPNHAKLVYFPGSDEPTWIYRDPAELDREFARRWGETGDLRAFRADEARVVEFLQNGYRAARPPSLADARQALGPELTRLWISGSARGLLDHYLTAEGTKVYLAMTVNESGPVSLDDPCSAFVIPMMDSGSVLDGYYGFVRGGIWQISSALGDINRGLGVKIHLASEVTSVDAAKGRLEYVQSQHDVQLDFDHLCLATDPATAARIVQSSELEETVNGQRLTGSAGKLNMMFRRPVRWKHGSDHPDSDSAFRFIFEVSNLAEFEQATLSVLNPDVAYQPGYLQIYCEGAAMRHMGLNEPFDRLAVFFKNLALNLTGDQLPEVEARARDTVLAHVENPEDCVWTRLLTPKDLQQQFLFPGGNLDHTMLVEGQTFDQRNYAGAGRDFYRFGNFDNISLCAAGSYPCGSVAGTPGYMCAAGLIGST